MNLFKAAWLLALKDARIELRTREITTSTGLFALLMVVLTSLSFYVDDTTARLVSPGVLWITVTYTGVLAIGRSWARERENDAMRGLLLSPVPRAAIYLGKALSTLFFVALIELMVVPMVALLFHVDLIPVLGPLSVILGLGTIGFVLTGTLFGAMTVRTRSRDLMLSVVVFPLVTPALLGGVVATRLILDGASLAEVSSWVRVLLAYDLVVGVAGFVMFAPLTND